jgi:hypothetical protein
MTGLRSNSGANFMTIRALGKITPTGPTGVSQAVKVSSSPDDLGASSPKPATVASKPTREAMIATAAYYLAEERHFEMGRELDDWLAAEKEFDSSLKV